METTRHLSVALLFVIACFHIALSDSDSEDYLNYHAGKSAGALKKRDALPGKSVKLESYSLTMHASDANAGSSSSFIITVFWNNEVYESIMYDPATSGTQTFLAFETFKYNDYNYFDAAGTKAKMLIQNNGNNDAAIFTSMKLTLEDGTYYEVESFCSDPSILGDYYSNFEIVGSACPIGQKQYEAVCVDGNPGLACNPSNIMVYFDKRNPNTVSTTAPMLDAAGKVMEGCAMHLNPSMSSECASKTKGQCDRARSCNLVMRTFGTEFKQYSERLLSIIHANDDGNVANMDFNEVLWITFSISASINLFYCYAVFKRRVKG